MPGSGVGIISPGSIGGFHSFGSRKIGGSNGVVVGFGVGKLIESIGIGGSPGGATGAVMGALSTGGSSCEGGGSLDVQGGSGSEIGRAHV